MQPVFVSDLVRNPNCWFSHAKAQYLIVLFLGGCKAGEKAVCKLCEKDFFKAKKGTGACEPCPDGQGTIGMGKRFCMSEY